MQKITTGRYVAHIETFPACTKTLIRDGLGPYLGNFSSLLISSHLISSLLFSSLLPSPFCHLSSLLTLSPLISSHLISLHFAWTLLKNGMTRIVRWCQDESNLFQGRGDRPRAGEHAILTPSPTGAWPPVLSLRTGPKTSPSRKEPRRDISERYTPPKLLRSWPPADTCHSTATSL